VGSASRRRVGERSEPEQSREAEPGLAFHFRRFFR
jgi:hypothetical protein